MVFPDFFSIGRGNDGAVECEQADVLEVAYGLLGIMKNRVHPDLMFMTTVNIECCQTDTELRSTRHQPPPLQVLSNDATDPVMLD